MVRAWRALDRLRGPLGAALVAVPDRHQRLPRPAAQPPAAGPADGPVGPVGAGRAPPRRHAAGHGLGRADPRPPRCCPRTPTRPSRRSAARVDPAGVRRRAAAPAAAAAGRADPARGAALEGRRGGRAARHHGRRRSTARCSGPARRWPSATAVPAAGAADRTPTASCSPATCDAFERYDIDGARRAAARGRHAAPCRRSRCGCAAPTRSPAGMLGPGIGCRGSRLLPPSANGSPAFAPVQAGGRRVALVPWCIQVLEISDGQISHIHHFLDTSLFERFGLPPYLDRRAPAELPG